MTTKHTSPTLNHQPKSPSKPSAYTHSQKNQQCSTMTQSKPTPKTIRKLQDSTCLLDSILQALHPYTISKPQPNDYKIRKTKNISPYPQTHYHQIKIESNKKKPPKNNIKLHKRTKKI